MSNLIRQRSRQPNMLGWPHVGMPRPITSICAMNMPPVVIHLEMIKRAAAANVLSTKKSIRRHQSKVNQRRYRQEQTHVTDQLNQSVSQLRADVARMEGSLDALRLAIPPSLQTLDLECRIGNEYFRVFANGNFLDPSTTEHAFQTDFLTNVMREDLVIMGSVGREKLIQQWTLYMTTFEAFSMDLHTLHVAIRSPNVVLYTESTLHLRLSYHSVQLLFPHLHDKEPLVQNMVGRTLHLPVQVHFAFDKNRIVQVLGTFANTTHALVNVVGNAIDTVAVLGDFQMSEEAELLVT
ncbi:hypothetical protein H257_15755 [Aphanomyces astaci]|uniref:BZIP domain-containing protein n=1 Tax=Aphanomyces astaci TaxID=112090 RepID=W4FN15_APHAT|nr:hypothetical protein H257_15755 [Aphanomyces astaci]ETV68316.1 hypothetical protein H257_15755 [Aphanomyces astaci]|eukprot:XP_009842259.1 hypothetical protein H257_15755 [Aphanomyces astaci]